MIGVTPFTTPQGAVTLLFSNPQVIQCIFLMMASAILNATGVTNYLAEWLINRNVLRSRPWLLIIMLMLATTAIGLVADIAAVVFIMWPLVHQIFEKVGYAKGDAARVYSDWCGAYRYWRKSADAFPNPGYCYIWVSVFCKWRRVYQL